MLSERDFLEAQAARARAALSQDARSLGDDLLAPLQLQPFIRRRPWWSLGGAVAAGFFSGAVLGRSGRAADAGAGGRGTVRKALAAVGRSVRGLVSGALPAIVLANLRRTPSVPVAPPTNGQQEEHAASGAE